jgi:hypothetical protein
MKLHIRSNTVTAGLEGLRLSVPLLHAISVVALIFGYLFGVGDRTQIFLILVLILTRHRGRTVNAIIAEHRAAGLKRGDSQIGNGGHTIQS